MIPKHQVGGANHFRECLFLAPMIAAVKQQFTDLFQKAPMLYRSPGRINIIGEHTDYNQGFVLPAAIEQAAYIAIGPREDNALHLYAVSMQELVVVQLTGLSPQPGAWSNYIAGVAEQFIRMGFPIKGFNMVLYSDVPIGAGLSSSAAIECAVAFALNECFHCGLDRLQLVHLAQKAEHEFAGVQCGIMDQFASMMGRRNHLIKLDCRSLAYEYIPFQLRSYAMILFDTNVKHSLAATAYNERRQQCEQGVQWIADQMPHVQTLRDADIDMLEKFVFPKNPLIYKRCAYVVKEIQRVEAACRALEAGDLNALGQLMYQTHTGLSQDYEVSCRELDLLVSLAKNSPGVIGARMMGGGFGGCTLNLVEAARLDELINTVQISYERDTNLPLNYYLVSAADGSGRVDH
ncbi:MAG TPA: galactokinase [Sediminibacterium sp.]|nr:galactokinase [Sediminibacterium sp.]